MTVGQADATRCRSRSSCWRRRTRSRWRGRIRCPRRSSTASCSSCASSLPARDELHRDPRAHDGRRRRPPFGRCWGASACWRCGRWCGRCRSRGRCRTSPCGWSRRRTRRGRRCAEVKRFVRYGSSPRGAQALMLAAKIAALRDGRFAPSFADVRRVAAAGAAAPRAAQLRGRGRGRFGRRRSSRPRWRRCRKWRDGRRPRHGRARRRRRGSAP